MLTAAKRIKVSAPGRVCFGGEKLDWLAGPSVVAAIGLRTHVAVSDLPTSDDIVMLRCHHPLNVERRLHFQDIGDYKGHVTDHLEAALKVICNCGVSLAPIIIEVASDIPFGSGLSSSAALCVASIER